MSDEGGLRVLVVDDEAPGRKRLEELLEARTGFRLLGSCRSGREAVETIQEAEPDLVFLDVQMPGMDGFDVLREVGAAGMPPVIFVTAHDRYAVDAFEVHALDYLLKPFDDERFDEALDRATRAIHGRGLHELGRRLESLLDDDTPGPRAGAGGYLQRIALPRRDGSALLRTEAIDWIEAADVYVRVHVGEESYLLRQTMSRLEASLDPERFARIHRSTIVNLDRVRRIHEYFRGEAVAILEDGTRLKIARGRRQDLEARFEP